MVVGCVQMTSLTCCMCDLSVAQRTWPLVGEGGVMGRDVMGRGV